MSKKMDSKSDRIEKKIDGINLYNIIPCQGMGYLKCV